MTFKTFFRENWAIIVAFLLPCALITLVALSVYLPAFFLKTNYNFLYATCTDRAGYRSYNCADYIQQRYSVVNTKLVVNPVDFTARKDYINRPDSHENYNPRIFVHNTEKNESREITLSDAQRYTLNNLLTSPDGVTVSGDYNSSNSGQFFIFGGRSSSYAYYLMKGGSRTKINIINDGDRYYNNDFNFIGWEIPGRN